MYNKIIAAPTAQEVLTELGIEHGKYTDIFEFNSKIAFVKGLLRHEIEPLEFKNTCLRAKKELAYWLKTGRLNNEAIPTRLRYLLRNKYPSLNRYDVTSLSNKISMTAWLVFPDKPGLCKILIKYLSPDSKEVSVSKKELSRLKQALKRKGYDIQLFTQNNLDKILEKFD